MAHSSPEGIILGKGSKLESLDLFINEEKLLSIKQEIHYSEEDMLEASKYGYNFHKTTQFPEQEFEDSCIRNTQQWMTKFKGNK